MRLAVAAAIIVAMALPVGAQEEVTEPRTGVSFATTVEGKSLLGVGLRIKKILFIKAKVYAVGLYVSDEALSGPLAKHQGKVDTPEFYNDLVWGDFDKHITLKFVRDLGEKKIQNAMREALEDTTDKKLLDQFVSYFPELKKGQECVMRWAPGGNLETTFGGETKPAIESKDFSAALFSLYVGEKPLQEDIKKGLVSRAAELLGS